MTVTFSQDHRGEKEKKKILRNRLARFFFFSIWMKFDLLLKCVNPMNVKLILSRPMSIEGRQPILDNFIQQNWNISLCLAIYKPISVRLYSVRLYSA